MTAIEMKYSLFRDIDSIRDEALLFKLVALVKSMLAIPSMPPPTQNDYEEIPEFVRNMSVKTDIPGNVNVKDLMHQHWDRVYGEGVS